MQFLAAATREMRSRQQEQQQQSTIYGNTLSQAYEEPPVLQAQVPICHDTSTSYGISSFSPSLNPPQSLFSSPGTSGGNNTNATEEISVSRVIHAFWFIRGQAYYTEVTYW